MDLAVIWFDISDPALAGSMPALDLLLRGDNVHLDLIKARSGEQTRLLGSSWFNHKGPQRSGCRNIHQQAGVRVEVKCRYRVGPSLSNHPGEPTIT
jgi:hypothetical protein